MSNSISFESFVSELTDEQCAQLMAVLKNRMNQKKVEEEVSGSIVFAGDELSQQISSNRWEDFVSDQTGWSLWIQYDIRRAGTDPNKYWFLDDGWIRVVYNETSDQDFFVDINRDGTKLRLVSAQMLTIKAVVDFKMKAYDSECAKLYPAWAKEMREILADVQTAVAA